MSDFWNHFYFKKINIKYIIIFYNNKFYLICDKINSKFPISGYAEFPEVVDISDSLFIWKSNYF